MNLLWFGGRAPGAVALGLVARTSGPACISRPATAGLELARRMAASGHLPDPPGALPRLASEIAEDRVALLQMMTALNIPVRSYKVYAAWIGEKAGRRTLRVAADRDSRLAARQLDELLARARQQADLLEDLRVGAAVQVIEAPASDDGDAVIRLPRPG